MVERRLFELFRRAAVSPEETVKCLLAHELSERNEPTQYVKTHFSDLVNLLHDRAYAKYLEQQREAGQHALQSYLKATLPTNLSRGDMIIRVSNLFDELDSFYLSLGQSRRTRAGRVFEAIIREMFRRLAYPFDEQQVINGKPDFVLPSAGHYATNPMDCVVFTAKRTLRERWRQIITEGISSKYFLATRDNQLSPSALGSMRSNHIYVVVPADLKQEHYAREVNVISFEEFFIHHLDPAMTRWRSYGVV